MRAASGLLIHAGHAVSELDPAGIDTVLAAGGRCYVVRTAWVYGVPGPGAGRVAGGGARQGVTNAALTSRYLTGATRPQGRR